MTQYLGHWTCPHCDRRQSNFNTYCAYGCEDTPENEADEPGDAEADRADHWYKARRSD
jgi:hypothetical protein